MKPSIGRIVHFVQAIAERDHQRVIHLPAIVVAVWTDTCVNLQVFTDGTNSEVYNQESIKWVTSVSLDESESPQPRTWHWPEKQ